MKLLQTRRKFYNKWLYKVTVKINNINVFRYRDLKSIPYESIACKDSKKIAKFLITIDNFQLRIENKCLDIYVNDQNHFNELIKKFESIIKHCFYPHPELISTATNPKDIIAKKLPHDRYRYKVFLKPHAIHDDLTKANYLKWLETQYPRILITDSTKKWFIKTSWNWDRRYMYVEDEQTLLLTRMKQNEVLGSIYTYKLSINN